MPAAVLQQYCWLQWGIVLNTVFMFIVLNCFVIQNSLCGQTCTVMTMEVWLWLSWLCELGECAGLLLGLYFYTLKINNE